MKAKLARRPRPPARVQRKSAPAALTRKPTLNSPPLLHVIDGGLDGGTLLHLQSVAGNDAVGQLIAHPGVNVQALGIGTLLRPAESAAAAAFSVGEAAGAPKAAGVVADVAD